ncbi:hypothetical protein [Geomonas agri]|uniref:hypothetical protein n=1 Tax=Geomonas agri TaxID=2873702 RepID=UPI001CD7735A|nr:hypothetical protein [Geomonas agri]
MSYEWKLAIDAQEQLYAVCPFCHTLNYASSDLSLWPHGVLGIAQVTKGHAKVFEHPDEAQLEVGALEGKKVVFGCSCGRLEMFEAWIWNSRQEIIDYITLRAGSEMAESRAVEEKAQIAKARLTLVKGTQGGD